MTKDYSGHYDVVLRRNADGLERLHRVEWHWHWGPQNAQVYGSPKWKRDGDLYWWTQGNMACDCARAECFARAGGEPDPDLACGDELYTAVKAILDNGLEVSLDDLPEPQIIEGEAIEVFKLRNG